ncbi:microsomal signal peptidase 25 kDa subunit [Thozetella sp. PMI_491]|nr:microsomal signal peptidase 25 kDa subunit [Thozetella sp. PMI_491]
MASQEKITVYNLADLKNTSDDAIPNYLNSLKFKQSHYLTDVRLGLGYTAFIIAGLCFLWDWKLGFQSTKYYTAAAVAVYSLLNGALTLWIWLVEKGTVYVGTAPSGETISISTSTKKNIPQYNVEITIKPKSGPSQTLVLSKPFTEWFDSAGHFIAPPFQTILATAIPVVGKLDPKRVKTESDAYTPEVLAALSQADVSVVGSASETTGADASSTGTVGKKGGKRRKA